jgi:phosphatidylserine/phosphatidylglycerophosphate/cardiolipin synthase-like enzyme
MGIRRFVFIAIVFLGLISIAFARGQTPTRLLKSTRKARVETRLNLNDVEVPKDKEVCFSPDEKCGEKIYKFIESAQKSLDIAIYDFNIPEIRDLILRKAAEPIKIRIIFDSKQSHGTKSLIPILDRSQDMAGNLRVISGKQKGSGIMHNKFIVRDAGTENEMIETGSFNYTNHARLENNENQVYLADKEITTRYKKRFNEIWKKSQPR